MPDHPEVQRFLGLALKDLRARAAISQEELSRRTGVHPTYISDIERGARNPSWAALVKLVDGLEAGMGDLGVAYDRVRMEHR
jgi:transcriptional regulator with XRE-family HTH domain